MCGIGLVLHACENETISSGGNEYVQQLKERMRQQLAYRGPDVQHEVTKQSQHTDARDDTTTVAEEVVSSYLWMFGSVLHIQGVLPAAQPFVDTSGNVLLWNGEVFGCHPDAEAALRIADGESDTVAVSRLLAAACDGTDSQTGNSSVSQRLTDAMSGIYGPYAFIYYHKTTGTLHFGRDPFGRRSLLLHGATDQLLELQQQQQHSANVGSSSTSFVVPVGTVVALSSVAPVLADCTEEWAEIDITGIYSLSPHTPSGSYSLSCTPWPEARTRLGRGGPGVLAPAVERSTVKESPAGQFLATLQDAVARRVKSIVGQSQRSVDSAEANSPMACESGSDSGKIGVLFSGGIDSVLLTAVLHTVLAQHLSIDLLNVTFIKSTHSAMESSVSGVQERDSPSALLHGQRTTIVVDDAPSPDRLAAIAAYLELQRLFPERQWRLVHIDVGESERFEHEQRVRNLIRPSDTHMDLNIGTAFWFAARGKGYLREYSAAEIARLLSVGAGQLDEGDDEVGGTGATATKGKQNRDRPLLRHGGAGAAAGVGRTHPAGGGQSDGRLPSAPALELVELAPSKYKCVVAACQRVSKAGCPAYSCKKCCDGAHRRSTLVSSRGAGEGEEGALCNPCPAHRTKLKHLNKMRVNAAAQKKQTEGAGAESAELDEAAEDVAVAIANEDSRGLRSTKHTVSEAAENLADMTIRAYEKKVDRCASATAERTVEVEVYLSRCKALLVGIGADEQMAGYGRHRTVYLKALADADAAQAVGVGMLNETPGSGMQAFESVEDRQQRNLRCAVAALEDELNKDLTRLWKRNLGRDDRCISDNGREAWFPFLDEKVVQLLQSLPMSQVADLSLPQGVGDKRILRQAARQLGLGQCTELVKRAIQFGTRVAQHTNQHYHGSNRKGSGTTKIDG